MVVLKQKSRFTKINKQKKEMLETTLKMVTLSNQYVKRNKISKAKIEELETSLNAQEKSLDAACVVALATGRPVAKALRRITTTLKMTSDLERIGDLAYSIVMCAMRYYELEKETSIDIVKKLSESTLALLKKVIICVEKNKFEEAREIRALDREIDENRRIATVKILQEISKDPSKILSLYELIAISQKYERIGDHCKNLAEELIYSEVGDDIKHER